MGIFRPIAFFWAVIIIMAGFAGILVPADSSGDLDLPPTRAETSFSFDFGPRTSPVMQSQIGITGSAIYDSRIGYGLLEPANEFFVTSRLGEINPHVLQRSWVYGQYSNHLTMDGLRSEDKVSFRVDIPNGTYRLVVWLGDLEKGVYSMNISVNDQWLMEGCDAFHTVHRSMYFKYNPDPRNPAKEYINYGMAIPYYLKVNVTEGYMVINITGNDDAYWDLLADELAKDPARSYLSWMSTGVNKVSAGTGPWTYIGGPFTNASVLGLNIHPYPDFPIDGEVGELTADVDIDATQVLNGISAANSGDLEGAFLHWKLSNENTLRGRNRLARSQLGMILAGALSLDREIEILLLVETDLYTNLDLRGDPALLELWTQINLTNSGLKYEFERILYDQDNPKNHFYEANKAFILLDQIPEGSPLYPKVQLWAARCLMNLDPHRWTSASGTALDKMEALRHLDPDNPYIRMYLDTNREDPATWEIPTPVISTTGVYDNWTLNDYNHGYGDAPDWALLMHEELGWLYDITDWWVDNRMQENGYLGGGWTDDVEMIGLFGFDALISEGADEKSLEGAGRFVDGMLASGQVNMELGFSQAFADVEHTAELTGDSLPMMVAVDFGNPKWVEFSMKTAALMRDLWMDENEKGWFQFKSNYLSATRVGTGGQAEDSWINFRAVLPALWAWWYSNDPEIQQLIVDWADGWVQAAMSTEKDKPEGIIPAGIGWPDGEIGGHNSPNWYTAAHPSGSVNYDWAPQKYKSYITTLLETAFDATRNTTFLEPLRLEAQIAQEYIDEPDLSAEAGSRKWAGKTLGSKAVGTYQSILDKYQLPGGGASSTLWRPHSVVSSCENGYDYIRKCYPLMTTEASATDRALFVGVANPFLIYTGGSIGGALLAPQFTYSGLERDFAAMVRDANARNANISLYGFFEGEREVAVLPWALEIGGRYSISVGPDEDSDGVMDNITSVDDFTFLSRGQKVFFTLPGDIEYLVTISQIVEGSGLRPKMTDPSFSVEDDVVVNKENGTVSVKVHNIGSLVAEDTDIYLYEDLDGGLRQIGGALDVTIPAPSGIEPSIIEVNMTVWYEPWIGEVVIIIDPEDEMLEISESNNEFRGYWDLEGINITELDEPIQMNGTLPKIEVFEDERADNVLDLKQYIWDPDGHGLDFSGATSRSSEWFAGMEDGVLSFSPNGDIGENWSGELVFNFHCQGPGKDGQWETDDDTEVFEFDIALEVLPVNDDPILEAIMVNGTRYERTEIGFNFHIRYDDGFFGEIIWSDVDGDQVILGLEEPHGGLSLENGSLILLSYDPEETITTFINITDGNGSLVKRIPISINIGEDLRGRLLGISFDGELIDGPLNNGKIQIHIQEWDEMQFYFIFLDVPDAYVIGINGSQGIVSGNGGVWTLYGIEVLEDEESFEVQMRWYLNRFSYQYKDFILEVVIHNVNRVPMGMKVQLEDTYYLDENITLIITRATDPDGDEINYTINWGDDGGWEEWIPGEVASHNYDSPGIYRISMDATDSWGYQQNLGFNITILERIEPNDDDDIDDDDGNTTEKKDDGKLSAIIAVLVVVIVIAMIVFILIMVRSKDEDEEYYKEEEGVDPLRAAIEGALEE